MYEQCVTDAAGRCMRWSHSHAEEVDADTDE